MAQRVIWSRGKMYISCNWILAQALRTLSMVRESGGAGVIQAPVKRAAATTGHRLGAPRHTELVGLPRSQPGLSVNGSDPPSPVETGFRISRGTELWAPRRRPPWLHLTRQSYLRPESAPSSLSPLPPPPLPPPWLLHYNLPSGRNCPA